MNATPQQLNDQEHYFDYLANLQMCDSLSERKEKQLVLSNGDTVEAVPWTENNEGWLNILSWTEK